MLQGGEGVRHAPPCPVRVVEVHGEPVGARRRARRTRGEQGSDCVPGRPDPDRVAERELRASRARASAIPGVDDLLDRHGTLPRGRRSTSTGSRARYSPQRGRASTTGANISIDSASEAVPGCAWRRTPVAAAEDRHVTHAEGERAVQAAFVRHQDRVADHVAQLHERQQFLGVSQLRHPPRSARSWSPRSPAARRRRAGRENSALTSTGTIAGSFCNPSRGPTSWIR